MFRRICYPFSLLDITTACNLQPYFLNRPSIGKIKILVYSCSIHNEVWALALSMLYIYKWQAHTICFIWTVSFSIFKSTLEYYTYGCSNTRADKQVYDDVLKPFRWVSSKLLSLQRIAKGNIHSMVCQTLHRCFVLNFKWELDCRVPKFNS